MTALAMQALVPMQPCATPLGGGWLLIKTTEGWAKRGDRVPAANWVKERAKTSSRAQLLNFADCEKAKSINVYSRAEGVAR